MMTNPNSDVDQEPFSSEPHRRRPGARSIAAEREKKRLRTRLLSIAGVAVLVAAVVAFVLYQRQTVEPASAAPAGTQSYDIAGAQHTNEPVTYAQQPPVGGEHHPTWQNCGFYIAPVPNETAVHSLEHGAIWITYQPDLPQDQVTTLRNQAARQSFVLVSPMVGLPAKVVASAWGQQIQLDAADDERLDQFIRRFRLSPEAPEPGAACGGGYGGTI